MKIGYTVWTWLMDEHNAWRDFSPYGKRDFEQSLREISDLGYQVVENFNMIVNLYEDAPEEFDGLLKKYNLTFVNVYHYLTADFKADMAMAERCCKFLERHGASKMNLEAPRISTPEATQKDLDSIVANLTEMGGLAQSYGVDLCLHPHYGTSVFKEKETDAVLERVSPGLFFLCMDTAHTQLAGMDPVKAFAKYLPYTRVVHLKDLDPHYPAESPTRGFMALGDGTVDLRGVYHVLRDNGYAGNLIVESDFQRVSNYESAKVSRGYIHRVMGL